MEVESHLNPGTSWGRALPYMPRLVVSWLRSAPGAPTQIMQGSLLAVDVSGFTDLSNRLAALGKLGSEELTHVIGTTFARLLKVAYDHNGSLIKFGGDALLLLFTGDLHQVRASQSAVGMQQELRRIRRLETSVGPITIQMSMGLACGDVHLFLVGDIHRELIVAGPTTSRAISLEGDAGAGEILIDAAIAKALSPDAVGEKRGKGRLLLLAKPRNVVAGSLVGAVDEAQIDEGQMDEGLADEIDLLLAIPAAVRNEVLSGIAESEHRLVTVAFVSYSGLDGLIAEGATGPVTAAARLHELVVAAQEAAAREGITFLGSDAARDGGKLILAAGAPHAIGEPEERMLLALSSLISKRFELPIRAGIHRGRVFAGHVGPPYRRTYTVMGDAVNLAARLMGKAAPGQLLTTETVLSRSRAAFEVEVLDPMKLKGFSEPVRAFAVGGVAGVRGLSAGHEAPLIGREQELALLQGLMSEARAGRGAVVEIMAEPGMGKSRLLAEAAKSAEGFRSITVACEPYTASTPYVPVRNLLAQLVDLPIGSDPETTERALRALVEQRAPDLIEWLPLLAVPFGLDLPATLETASLEARFRKERVELTIDRFLQRVLDTPLILTVEDTHWIDDASADMFRRLNAEIGSRPWLLCFTCRDASGALTTPDDGAYRIALSPLSPAAAQALIDVEGGTPLVSYQVQQLVERAGGNPMFLRELLWATTSGEANLPESVEMLVMERIDRLASEGRRLLRYAAVIGQTFSSSEVGAMLGSEIPDLAWEQLSDFVESAADGRYRFKHALVRDAAYEGLPFGRRRSLHALAGEGIEKAAGGAADEEAGLLAVHFYEARDYERAWRYAVTAGRHAAKIYANVEAARFLGRATEPLVRRSAASPQELADVYELLGDVLEHMGAYAAAARSYRAARRLVFDQPVRAASMFDKQSVMAEHTGGFPQALRWLRHGLDLLAGVAGLEAAAMRAKLMGGYGAVRLGQGKLKEAMEWSHQAIAEAEAVGVKSSLAQAYQNIDAALAELGAESEVPYAEMALSLFEEMDDLVGQANVLNNMGTRAYWKGRWNEARDLYDRSRQARERMGDEVNAAADGINNVAEILSDQGHLLEAETLFRQTLRVHQSVGHRIGLAYAWSNLGRVAYRSGRYDEAMPLLRQARAEFANLGMRNELLETDARIVECLVFEGRWEEAEPMINTALKDADQIGGLTAQAPMLHRVRAIGLMQAGSLDAAVDELEISLVQGRAREADFEIALTLSARSHLATLQERGTDQDEESERLDILSRLGVVAVPSLIYR